MSDPLRALPGKIPEDDPVGSFQSMEEEIAKAVPDTEIGDPILPCQKPFLEVWLLDDALSPVPAQCHVTLPTGKAREGPLNSSGYVKFENFYVDEPDVINTMAVAVIESTGDVDLSFKADGLVEEESSTGEDTVKEPDLYDGPSIEDW
jgi:hypothetical protein